MNPRLHALAVGMGVCFTGAAAAAAGASVLAAVRPRIAERIECEEWHARLHAIYGRYIDVADRWVQWDMDEKGMTYRQALEYEYEHAVHHGTHVTDAPPAALRIVR